MGFLMGYQSTISNATFIQKKGTSDGVPSPTSSFSRPPEVDPAGFPEPNRKGHPVASLPSTSHHAGGP